MGKDENEKFNEFKKLFNGNFWKTINKHFLFFPKSSFQKKCVLKTLWNSIQEKKYYPSIPKEYIYLDKGNGVVRQTCVFEIQDYCLYYYCIKELEDKIAINRIENTFGGWSLSGQIRKKENEELNNNNDEYGFSSFNPTAWAKIFGEFNSILFNNINNEEYKFAIEFDIANFYDNIRLDVLENKIREITKENQKKIVSLLFHFLHYWNRKDNFYNKQTVGIPQDVLGDCSRILANFYLQDYDKFMFKICKRKNCCYLRYTDDQFIFAKDKSNFKELIFEASKYLKSIGLNINQKKVSIKETNDLKTERMMDLFVKTNADDFKENNQLHCEIIKDYKKIPNKKKLKNQHSIIKKLLNCDLKQDNKKYILNIVTNKKFLSTLTYKCCELEKIYSILEQKSKEKFLKKLIQIQKKSFQSLHNSFYYAVLSFSKNPKYTDDIFIKPFNCEFKYLK